AVHRIAAVRAHAPEVLHPGADGEALPRPGGTGHRERRAANEPHPAGAGVPGRVVAGRRARLDRGVRQVAEVHRRVEAPEAVELIVADGDVRGVDRTHDAGLVAHRGRRGQGRYARGHARVSA